MACVDGLPEAYHARITCRRVRGQRRREAPRWQLLASGPASPGGVGIAAEARLKGRVVIVWAWRGLRNRPGRARDGEDQVLRHSHLTVLLRRQGLARSARMRLRSARHHLRCGALEGMARPDRRGGGADARARKRHHHRLQRRTVRGAAALLRVHVGCRRGRVGGESHRRWRLRRRDPAAWPRGEATGRSRKRGEADRIGRPCPHSPDLDRAPLADLRSLWEASPGAYATTR